MKPFFTSPAMSASRDGVLWVCRSGILRRRATGLALPSPSRCSRSYPRGCGSSALAIWARPIFGRSGSLPFARPQNLSLVLQDINIITPSTESTSIFEQLHAHQHQEDARHGCLGRATGLFDLDPRAPLRRFVPGARAMSPPSRCAGSTTAAGRQALDQVGFDFVVEAGLGRGHRDFRAIRLHTLPGVATGVADLAQRTGRRSGRGPPRIQGHAQRAEHSIAVASRCSPARPSARRSSAPQPPHSP